MVDQFKKQVMFLHPEPTVMQPCASMLGEQISVHMASSGTEALTTLGITPIDIIVSAQDLPGMTGQEALREAKKRSPGTRGILIANDAMTADDMAALVNVRHLNQILNANVSVNEICAAILFELKAKETGDLPTPANDHSAGPREGTATGSYTASSTGSFRTDSFRADATGSFETLKENIPVLEPGAGAAAAARTISEVELLVLTNDSSFLKTIRAATGSSHVVNHAPNLQEAVDVVQEGRCGVLITDAAVAVKDVETITAKLRRHMPSLVTIVAGRREDGEKMMGLINDGLVYRFLLKPISPGRSRLAIEASAKKHLTLVSTDVPLTPDDVEQKMTETGIIKGVTFDSGLFRTTDVRESNINMPSLDDDIPAGMFSRISDGLRAVPPLLLAGIAVAVTLVGVFVFGGEDQVDRTQQPTEVPAPRQTPAAQPAKTNAERGRAMVDSGRQALSEGRVYAPEDNNAVYFFSQAAALDRDNAGTRAQLDNVLADVYAAIEQLLIADNINEAGIALSALNKNVPGHPRLEFFNTQLARERARQDLTSVESDILSGNFDRASTAIDRMRADGVIETSILDGLESRVRTAIDSTRQTTASSDTDKTQTLLATATQRLERGQLIAPANDSARFYFQSALQLDPSNQQAREGLTTIARTLLEDARAELGRNNIAVAETLWLEAVDSGANAIEAESVRRQIETLRQQNSRVPVSRAPAAARDTSPADAGAVATSSTTTPDETDLGDTRVPEVPATIRQSVPDTSPAPVAQAVEAAELETDTNLPEKTGDNASPAETQTEQKPEYKLVIRRSVAPTYPRRAELQRLEGWVDVGFNVDAEGATNSVRVIESTNSVFESAAVDAVSRWRYEPLSEDDPTASKSAKVRLKFNLD